MEITVSVKDKKIILLKKEIGYNGFKITVRYFNGDEICCSFDTKEECDKAYELILAKYTQDIWDLDADDPKHADMLPRKVTMEDIAKIVLDRKPDFPVF